VYSWLDVVDATSRVVCSGHLQCRWGDIVQQLQCRLCVSSWFELVNTSWCDVPRGAIQRLWRDVVQQL
jgi:hypothetical protein